MRKDEYIQEVISRIENKKAKAEVEKELSNHIDDRISYYTDAGWDEETANEKAMEHMGAPEKVSEEMGKLHISKKGKIYHALLGLLCLYTAIHYIWLVLTFVMNDWTLEIDLPLYFTVLPDVIIGMVLFVSIVVSHKYKSILYYVAIGIECSILVCIIGFVITNFDYIITSFLAALMMSAILILTVICCGRKNDEKTRFKDESRRGRVKKLFEGFLFPVISFYIAATLAMGFLSLFATVISIEEAKNAPLEKAYNERVKTILREYLAEEMPTEVATEEEVKGFNLDDYTRGIGEWDVDNLSLEKWRLDESLVKPVKVFPAKYNRDGVTYYLTNTKGIIIEVSTSEFDADFFGSRFFDGKIENVVAENVIQTDCLINSKFIYPYFETAKVSEMYINGVDLAPAFDDDGLEMIRMLINNAEYVKPEEVDPDLKVTGIEWHFEDTPALYNTFGLFMYDYDGNYYFLRALNENVMSPSGEKTRMCSSGIFKVDDETSEKIKKIIDKNRTFFDEGQKQYDGRGTSW